MKRLGEPRILAEKKAEWQKSYDEKRAANPRPESKQYAHKEIVDTLKTMSHGKCFYCEGDGPMTVDHYIEVAERGDLAFTWENLYLACKHCQKKVRNSSIPVTDCVDPCDPATDPADHLKFEAEIISWRTPRGEQTVKKYRLKLLDNDRIRLLRQFDQELKDIGRTKPWPQMSAAEREQLRRYAKDDMPFSAMFRAYLDRHGLLHDA
ncbi:MAG: HNH endonuclease [Minicystis sp.]